MCRAWPVIALGLACLFLNSADRTAGARGKDGAEVQWVWSKEGDPAREAPAGIRYFRRSFDVPRTVDEAALDVTADNRFTVWVNGNEVGRGDDWKRVYRFDVKKHLIRGQNVIAVEAENTEGPAGLLVRLDYLPNGQSRSAIVSGATWRTSPSPGKAWQKPGFDDGKWALVKVLGPAGKVGPWQGLVWDAGGADRFTVPQGFVVEKVANNPDPKDPFSLINLTFDAKGRLLVSQEGGPTLLCTNPDKDGVFTSVEPYCTQVKSSQGMCWVKDALLLAGDGPQGTGLYRVRDTNGDDKTDDVKLLHKFKGSMGEHGPHAIIHGPDDWLYLVVGNHAWAQPAKLAANSPLTRWPNGQMGPDQGKPGTTEDVLLPRLNDSRGHAANILAPGGTIWRMDHDGKNMSLVTAGFRNHFDAAFNPDGELFTYDSDMEWDEALPWYRPVRVCHCPPGADFVWRTGAANTPDYYIDSLPPVYETGRGSPVGVEFYDHAAFPKKYRGALFLADWSVGLIYAVHLKRSGASFKAEAEKFCAGNPLNVTDLVVGMDGALYFTMGGRRTQGGVYRIVYEPEPGKRWSTGEPFPVQPLAKMLPPAAELLKLVENGDSDVRAHAVRLLGSNVKYKSEMTQQAISTALGDKDALVRRRACEAMVRAGFLCPVDDIWPLLADKDRFVRTAARLVLQRIPAMEWTGKLADEPNDHIFLEGVIALCKTNQAARHGKVIFDRLSRFSTDQGQPLLDYLRTVQMALIHAGKPSECAARAIIARCGQLFPQADGRVNRELAILLTHFRRSALTTDPVHARLLATLQTEKDRQQQIHYFYCLRLLHNGWTPEQKADLLTWYDATKSWEGGHSFTPFLENILRDLNGIFTGDDRVEVVAKGEKLPLAAAVLLKAAPPEQIPAPDVLAALYDRLLPGGTIPHSRELKEAVVETLARSPSFEAPAALRRIGEKDPSQRDVIARSLAKFPTPENWPFLVHGLESTNPLTVIEVVEALRKIPTKPKPEEAGPYRALLLASGRLTERDRWKVVQLLRHWGSGRQFGAEEGDWKPELTNWAHWFGQAFPKEPALPDVVAPPAGESKYKFAELLAFLEKDPAGTKGDPGRGRLAFEKAQCLKCHKYGKEGEGIGPDLSTVSKRFKRTDILESIIYPSKVISDQYRSTSITTITGRQIIGLAAPQGDTVTVLLSDGTKVTLKKGEIDQQFASLVSVMPERGLDPLSKQEIADLFAFLESEPK